VAENGQREGKKRAEVVGNGQKREECGRIELE
jgi:hypothetical protein